MTTILEAVAAFGPDHHGPILAAFALIVSAAGFLAEWLQHRYAAKKGTDHG